MSKQLDTRSLQERLDELTELKDAVETAQTELDELLIELDDDSSDPAKEKVQDARDALELAQEEFRDVKDEYEELESLSEEVSEWNDGNQLIPVDDFEDYCRDLLDDIGDLPKNLPSYIVIDWSATADNLKADYSECEYQGETYLYRCS